LDDSVEDQRSDKQPIDPIRAWMDEAWWIVSLMERFPSEWASVHEHDNGDVKIKAVEKYGKKMHAVRCGEDVQGEGDEPGGSPREGSEVVLR
jgi:hypothetical protein